MANETDAPLSITRDDAPDGVVLSLAGELDPHTAPDLQDVVEAILAGDGPGALALDLGGLTFVDSSGLRVIIAAKQGADERGWSFELRSPSDTVQRLLDVTGLTDHITIRS